VCRRDGIDHYLVDTELIGRGTRLLGSLGGRADDCALQPRLDDPLRLRAELGLCGVLNEVERAERLSVRSRAIICKFGSIKAIASSRVSATTALTVKNVTGSDARSLGLNSERYAASASAVP
jgi:hypothetical protein